MKRSLLPSIVLVAAGCSLLNGAPSLRCEGGSSCEADCADGEILYSPGADVVGESCDVSCEPGSSCRQICGASGGCTQVCEDADCTLLCVEGDCRQQCIGGSCELRCVGGDCHQVCRDGAECSETSDAELLAVSSRCSDGWQCASGFCLDGLCMRGCAIDGDCPEGFRCSLETGFCHRECTDSSCRDGRDCQTEVRSNEEIAVCK